MATSPPTRHSVPDRRQVTQERGGSASGGGAEEVQLAGAWSAINLVQEQAPEHLAEDATGRKKPVASESSAGHRVRCRRPARSYAHADGDTDAHNTLSPDKTSVRVFYPFHPLHRAILQILRRPERGDGAVCVLDPGGRRLKIPVWMLEPECARITISGRPHLGKEALLSLALLIGSQPDSKDCAHDDNPRTAVSGSEGGHRGATPTSGPDGPKRARPRVDGRSDTRRSHRPDGTRCHGGFSRGARDQ